MKKVLMLIIFVLLTTVFTLSFFIIQGNLLNNDITKNIIKEEPTPMPLLAYTFENLKKSEIPDSEITFGDVTEEADEYFQRIFYFNTPERPGMNETLKVSGLATFPKNEEDNPVIIMYRGYIPEDGFVSGAGTSPSARELARNGYITLAPDFLGFGESDYASKQVFEDRFQTYTTSLALLESLKNLNKGLDDEYEGTISADVEKLGVWGHSNGGHIALSTLAITGLEIPAVLWAPVSKSFPYSILFYTDETDDQGEALRAALDNFEEIYDTADFSPERYYKWIKAQILINQGTNDQEIPFWWSEELSSTLEDNELEVELNLYPEANHNLQPSWSDAINSTIKFFNQNIQ